MILILITMSIILTINYEKIYYIKYALLTQQNLALLSSSNRVDLQCFLFYFLVNLRSKIGPVARNGLNITQIEI